MLDAIRYLAIAAVITAPLAAHGQARIKSGFTPTDLIVQADYNDLELKDQRRLDFYAEKIVVEIIAIVNANEANDVATSRKHEEALKSMAERLLVAAEKSGLTESEADTIFRGKLIDGFSGALPSFMVTDTGLAGVRDLISLGLHPVEPGAEDYVDSVRDAGETLFKE